MNDIFISYKNEDRPWAQKLARVLQQLGYTVWWDREISPGQTWDEVIEEALTNSKCVIVLWSGQSVKSSWVKNEADEGANRNILLPVMIEDVKIPLAYRRIQTANLMEWDGDLEHKEFKIMLGSIERISGKAPKTTESVKEPEKESAKPVEKTASDSTGKRAKKASSSSKSNSIMIYIVVALSAILVFGVIERYLLPDKGTDNQAATNQTEIAENKSTESSPTKEKLPKTEEKPADSDVKESTGAENADRAIALYSELQTKELDPEIRDADLLSDYQKLLKTFQDTLNKDVAGKIRKRIGDLEVSVAGYKSIISLDKRKTAVVRDRIAAWEKSAKQSRNSPEKREAAEKIRELEHILYSELQRKELDASIRDADLLSDYKEFRKTFQNTLSENTASQLRKRVKDLEASVAGYKSIISLEKSETAVFYIRMAAWEKFAEQRRNSPERREAIDKIKEMQNMIDNTATISGPDHFVTCREVDENTLQSRKITEKFRTGAKEAVERIKNLKNMITNTTDTSEADHFVICQEVDKDTVQPLNITEKFHAGDDVTVWAIIHAPKKEDLQMVWYVDGKEVQSRIVAVSESLGFRTCDVASSSQYIGLNEVRLYNSQNILIGRKNFSTSD